MKGLRELVLKKKFIFCIYVLAAIVTAVQQYVLGPKPDTQTHYNNFVIFRQSFFHLITNIDLYKHYPVEYYDLYKYSPTFALFMGVFAMLPLLLSLIAWNILNAVILFLGIKSLPFKDEKVKSYILWFVFIESITSMQNLQSNGLIAGLLLLSYSFMERKNLLLAALCISLTVFIKIFGVLAFIMFLFYPNKIKSALYSVGCCALLLVLPLIVVSPSELIIQYNSWRDMLKMDFDGSVGFSVLGWLNYWFHLFPPRNLVTLAGIILILAPLIFIKRYKEKIFRLLYFANIIIWVIIFNHKAESATFIIAVCGIALWFFSQKQSTLNIVLIITAFVFTCLSPTDIFPPVIRHEYFVPYIVKAVPCIIIWFKIIYELITSSYQPKENLLTE